ncbi:FeoA family protein [Luminiphilus syltensis]|nr:FeoA family protein [Luminiphilus syltensis]
MNASAITKTLWSLQAGDAVRVIGFDDSLPERYRVRLEEFGFHPGENVECLMTPGLGAPKLYRVSNTVFSLDDDIASCVLVQMAVSPGAAL